MMRQQHHGQRTALIIALVLLLALSAFAFAPTQLTGSKDNAIAQLENVIKELYEANQENEAESLFTTYLKELDTYKDLGWEDYVEEKGLTAAVTTTLPTILPTTLPTTAPTTVPTTTPVTTPVTTPEGDEGKGGGSTIATIGIIIAIVAIAAIVFFNRKQFKKLGGMVQELGGRVQKLGVRVQNTEGAIKSIQACLEEQLKALNTLTSTTNQDLKEES